MIVQYPPESYGPLHISHWLPQVGVRSCACCLTPYSFLFDEPDSGLCPLCDFDQLRDAYSTWAKECLSPAAV